MPRTTKQQLVVKNPPANAGKVRNMGSDPWVRKIPQRKKWQPTPAFLPGEFHGQNSLADYSPWGRKESYMIERLTCTLSDFCMTLASVPHSFASQLCSDLRSYIACINAVGQIQKHEVVSSAVLHSQNLLPLQTLLLKWMVPFL